MSDAVSSSSGPVADGIAAVRQALRAQHEAYLDGLRTDGLTPLQEEITQGLAAHDDARTPLTTLESPSRHTLWDAIRDYRQATMERVWTPLRTRLDAIALGSVLGDQRATVRKARSTLAEVVPTTVTRPEPETLYANAPSDGWTRRLAKWGVRTGRHLYGLVAEQTLGEQTVPLAAMVQREAERALSETEGAVLDAAEQRVVGWMARLERTASTWTHQLLDMERTLDHPTFHGPEALHAAAPEEPVDDPTAGVMTPDRETICADLREQADALHACLQAGQALSLNDIADRLRAMRDETVDRLHSAAQRADTFMAEGDDASPPPRTQAARERRRARTAGWADWDDEVQQRLALLDTLTQLRDALTDRHRALVDDGVAVGFAPARTIASDAVDQLHSLRDDIDALLASPADGDELDLIQAFSHQVDTGHTIIEDTLLGPLQALTPRRSTKAVLDAHREAIASLLDTQPEEFVVHPLPDPEAEQVEPGEASPLEWTHECNEVLDDLLFEEWRTGLEPLVAAAEARTERATEVRAVVAFNLEAALEELQDLRAARRDGRGDGSYVADARELAFSGLDRAIELLRSEDDELMASTGTVLGTTWKTVTTAWTDLHNRLRAAGQAHAHVLRAQGRLVRGTRWLAVEAERRGRMATTQLRRTLHRAQRQAQRLVRLGHAAVGTTAVDEAALRETVDALATVDTVLADLPLVYRRLFSFRPLQGDNLLVGRASDRVAIEQHAERWQDGLTNPMVVTGPAGSGRTSLLNVLRKTSFRSAQRHSITLTERVTSEADFAERVVQALNLSLSPTDDFTLATVAEHLKAQPAPDRLRLCTIEHFEHLFRRTVGGTTLGARVLNFLSATDTRVFWLFTTTDTAWQVVEASEPAAAQLPIRHELNALDREALETLIMTRHQRSGLPLVFDPPEESRHPILSRRIRAIDDDDRQQAFLRTEFFDRLHEVCGQNVMLALFYWFRSVTLDADETALHVRPLAPISFELLDTLPLPHAFVLKALLEHRTLTVEELAAVQGLAPDTSRALLETLGNALLIAPADRVEGPGVFRFASVEPGTRYRIRPLLIHPVTRFLRSRNIVH